MAGTPQPVIPPVLAGDAGPATDKGRLLAMDSVSPARHWIGLLADSEDLHVLRFAEDGQVPERRKTAAAPILRGSAPLADAINELCSDWLQHSPATALVGAGLNALLPADTAPAPIEVPFELAPLARLLRPIRQPGLPDLHLLPDFAQNGILPGRIDHGTAALLGVRSSTDEADLLVGLLGEQHQWVRLDRQRVRRLVSFITPSLQRLLSGSADQSADTPTDTSADWHAGAFDFGLAVARGEEQQAGMLASLGSPQALVRSGQLAATEQGSFRHGLLIGHELLGLKRMEPDAAPHCPVILVGPEDRCLRYARALQLFGFEHVERARQAAERGLWQLARTLDHGAPEPAG